MALGLFALGSTGLATLPGCAGLMGGGAHRSEQFTANNAPEPTVSTAVFSCVTKALPPGSGAALTARFDALARTAMPAAPVTVSPAATVALCGTVFGSDSFHAWHETTPVPSAIAVIHELAQATGAKSIAIPAMRLYARCEKDQKTVRDANGVPIATIDENTQTCRMDRLKDIGLFLFSADGTILYRSTKRAGTGSSEDPEPEMNEVLANIPATFSAPAGGAGAMAPSMGAGNAGNAGMAAPGASAGGYAQPAAPQGVGPADPQIDSAIGELDDKAPAPCKKFIKTMCRNPSVPDASRLPMCSGYVSTVNQLVQRQGAKSADACKGLLKSATQ